MLLLDRVGLDLRLELVGQQSLHVCTLKIVSQIGHLRKG